jgi:hypothetical protein
MESTNNYTKFGFFALVGLMLVGLAISAVPSVAQEEEEKSEIEIQLEENLPRALPSERILIDDLERPARTGPKWIGLACRDVSDLVRTHIALPEAVGLVVEEVVPESPADQVGLKKHDILVKAGGQELTSLRQLIDIVHDSPAEGFELEWLRHGDTVVAELVPVERPAELMERRRRFRDARPAPHIMGRLQDWIDRLGTGEEGDVSLDLRFFGDAFPADAEDFPADLRVQIQREGNEGARINVQRGNDSWEVSEDDLDQLPDDLRPHVERMLGGSQVHIWPHGDEDAQPPWSAQQGAFPDLKRQMDEMHEQMQRMFEELKELRQLERFQEDQEQQKIESGVDA